MHPQYPECTPTKSSDALFSRYRAGRARLPETMVPQVGPKREARREGINL